jgi:hypothetical protein
LLAIALIFHRPIIFGVGRSVANRYAAKANLKIECSLGGTILTGLVVRNLHVVPIGPTVVESIDVDYIIGMMRQDWGFYYTFTTNLKRVPDYLDQFSSLGEEGRRVIRRRIDGLHAAIESAPKTFGWKMRSKIGTRSRWYQDVSEKSQQY